MRIRWGAAALCAALLLAAAMTQPASAQISNASAAALGMGENYTAAARGYHAVAWNPALLATTHTPASSFTFFGVGGFDGLEPVTVADLATWQNRVVPDEVRRRWLEAIRTRGGQAGSGGGDINWVALQFGRFALHGSTSAGVRGRVSPGVAEMVMFGNVAADGTPVELELGGSRLRGALFSALGVSYAHPIELPGTGRLALGVTGTYVLGHGTAWGDESFGAAQVDPLAIDFAFPLVYTRIGDDAGGGSGVGLDVGAALEIGMWTVAATVRNAVNSFAWEESALVYRPLLARFDEEQRATETEERPIAEAPAALREAVLDQRFRPELAGGVALRPGPRALIAADVRVADGESVLDRPRAHAGVGAEYFAAPWLPLRAGGALISRADDDNGWQVGAGAGVRLGPITLALSYLRRESDGSRDNVVMFGGFSSLR